MIDLFAEGIESLGLPCSWVFMLPAAGATALAMRRGPHLLAAFVAAAVAVAWLRFGGWWFAVPDGWRQVGIGVVLIGLASVTWLRPSPVFELLTALAAGTAAAWAWIPCVGPHLGELLNNARDDALSQLPGTAAFMVGLTAPFVIAVAAAIAVPRIEIALDRRGTLLVGLSLIAALGLLFATTLFDDLASELARRSSF